MTLFILHTQFYSDWWNSSSWAIYYRKWNRVVHNFLHRHIFLEMSQIIGLPRGLDMLATFLVSAVIHEVRTLPPLPLFVFFYWSANMLSTQQFIIGFAFGFYKPILMLMFSIPGVLFIYLSKIFGDARFLNIFMY